MFSPTASITKMIALVMTFIAYGVATTNGASSPIARPAQPR
jgi:hypothetical protein